MSDMPSDEPVEVLSLSVSDLNSVGVEYPSEVTDYHVRVRGDRSTHTIRFVGGGCFIVTYSEKEPIAYQASGVPFVRWDADTISVSAHPMPLLVPASLCHLALRVPMMQVRDVAD